MPAVFLPQAEHTLRGLVYFDDPDGSLVAVFGFVAVVLDGAEPRVEILMQHYTIHFGKCLLELVGSVGLRAVRMLGVLAGEHGLAGSHRVEVVVLIPGHQNRVAVVDLITDLFEVVSAWIQLLGVAAR